MKKYYSVEKFAEKHAVNLSTVHRWVQKKKYPSLSISQRIPQLIIEEIDSSPVVFALMNLKGGCAKTTVACHLASLLSKLEYRVLLVDTDHQNQCELFFPEQGYKYTIKDILNRNAPIESCIYPTSTKTSSLDIIYSDYGLALMTHRLSNKDELKNLLEPIKHNYDYIIIDTSPDFDMMNINVARIATHVIIPVVPVTLHMKGMVHNFTALEEVAEVSNERIIGIVPTIVNDKIAQHKAYLELLKTEYGALMYSHYIPLDNHVPKINDFNLTIFDYREKSKASQAFKWFVWETLQRL